jgi:steroid 5-alpha reductase family enzyme
LTLRYNPKMSLTALLLVNLAVAFGLTFVLWLISAWRRDASIIDIFWGPALAVLGWTTLVLSGSDVPRAWLLVLLATIWGLRLGIYLAWRNWGKGEDFRYRQMREYFGKHFWLTSLFVVFWLQAAIMNIVALPLVVGQLGTAALWWLDGCGVAVWLAGLAFESIGDWQLARFKANPENQGKVLDRGLWRYTRHPNYFGDFLVWWGIYLIALAGGAWWTLVGPLVMSWLLTRISGVTLLERSIDSRRPDYASYQKRTSAFFPWPPG